MVEGLCPRCARSVGVPYGYPPYAHWASAAARPPVTFLPAAPTQCWRPCVGARRITFVVTVGVSFVVLLLMLHGAFAHKHNKRKKERTQRIECIMPLPPDVKTDPKTDPLKQVTPPPPAPRYGPAPQTLPVPTGEPLGGSRYRSYRPAPETKPVKRTQPQTPGVVQPAPK